ncbi:helix-turn-helix domain-containing protein [Clostridium baratii]|uniref:helix-turn-helix domain-containing protein n=1 Tax=Clostridium baratii TaxID=1561 RepID=UPI001C24F8DF|nr:helix-turn-helix transcriptional regulator [Clostridium baratii]STB71347.1 MerR family transcriptional regulator [Clostridium baratii]
MSKIGKRLKDERLKLGLSLQYMEEKTGVNAAYIYRIEEGERKNPSIKIIKRICDFYKLDFIEIIYLMV